MLLGLIFRHLFSDHGSGGYHGPPSPGPGPGPGAAGTGGFCAHCGAQFRDATAFCPHCGARRG
ncbi:MAG: zinc-ribbon domain-containing protein [Bryobacteraceae bacterium]